MVQLLIAIAVGGTLAVLVTIGALQWRNRRARERAKRHREKMRSVFPEFIPPPPAPPRQSDFEDNPFDFDALSPEPVPLTVSSMAVERAQQRARARMDSSIRYRNQGNEEQALEQAEAALAELSVLKRDHWYAAEILNLIGCLQYDRGFYLEAREIWEQAQSICLEWPERVDNVLKTVESNLKLVSGMLGF